MFMGNDPQVQVVAKTRSELTDRIAIEIIKNFAKYNASRYMRVVGMHDPRQDGYRCLRLNPFQTNEIKYEVYGGKPMPRKALGIDFDKNPQVMGSMTFASLHVYTDLDEVRDPSISKQFPYKVAAILLDPVSEDEKEIVTAACGPPLELIQLDSLKLTPGEQKKFRIVPFWEWGPEDFVERHITYEQWRRIGIEELTKIFCNSSHGIRAAR